MLNTLSQLSLSARGDAELGAVTPGDSQAASSTLPTERAQSTLRSENGTADTNTASADMHGAGAASVQSTVSYPADKAEYQRLVSAGVRNLPNTAAEYARFKHTNPEGWYELIRRESRRNPAITSLLDNGAASVAGYTEDAGEEEKETRNKGEEREKGSNDEAIELLTEEQYIQTATALFWSKCPPSSRWGAAGMQVTISEKMMRSIMIRVLCLTTVLYKRKLLGSDGTRTIR